MLQRGSGRTIFHRTGTQGNDDTTHRQANGFRFLKLCSASEVDSGSAKDRPLDQRHRHPLEPPPRARKP